MDRALVDTNIWAADEMGYQDAVDYIEHLIDENVEIIMTTMVKMELKSYHLIEEDQMIKDNREKYINQMADEVFHITEAEMELAAEIRRKARGDAIRQKSIKAPDALIAASALVHNATLISNNDKDFDWIVDNFTYKGRKLDYMNPIKDKEDYSKFSKAYSKSKGL